MRTMLTGLRHNELLRHNAIFFAGSVAVGALNYLYYPILGRLMEPRQFGEVQTLVTLFLQIIIFMTVLATITVNIVANNPKDPAVHRTVAEIEKVALLISLIGLLSVVVAGPWLRSFFRFDAMLPFVVLAMAAVVTIPATFRTAYLRGHKKFGMVSTANIIGAAAKLGLSAGLVLLGFGVIGAMLGLVLAQALSFGYAAWRCSQLGFRPSLRTASIRLNLAVLRPHIAYAGLVLLSSLAVTIMYSVDIVAVKHYFDAQTAGLYAGVATVARIIFFLTVSITQVLLPAVTLSARPGRNRQVLLKSIYLLTAVGGSVLSFFWIWPEFAMRLLLGEAYTTYSGLLPKLSLAIFLVSLLNLIILYFVALRHYAIGFIAIIGIVATCGLVGTNHDSLQAIVDNMLLGVAITAVFLTGWVLKRVRMGSHK